MGSVFSGIFASVIWNDSGECVISASDVDAPASGTCSPSSGAGFLSRLWHQPIRSIIVFRLLATGRREANIVESNRVLLSCRFVGLILLPCFPNLQMKTYDNRCFSQHRMRYPIHTAVPFALADISICQLPCLIDGRVLTRAIRFSSTLMSLGTALSNCVFLYHASMS